jgi:predicted RNA binding protein YcfA (HicA-like mRNA interferase family)
MAVERNTRKVISRLKREGWIAVHGGKHDKFGHPDRPGILIVIPRHKELSIGVAKDAAEKAGWS